MTKLSGWLCYCHPLAVANFRHRKKQKRGEFKTRPRPTGSVQQNTQNFNLSKSKK